MIISIKNIVKALLIHELIKNVYNKSDASKKMYADSVPASVGIPTVAEIEALLNQNQGQFIGSIDCVKLHIDFSKESIDTSVYDRTHHTGTDGIETAMEVIEKVRKSMRHVSAEKIVWEGNVPAGYYIESTGGEVIVTGIVCKGATVVSKYHLTIQGGFAEDETTLIAHHGIVSLKQAGNDVTIRSEKLSVKLESIGDRANITAEMYVKIDQNTGKHCVITTGDWVSAKTFGASTTINANGGVTADVISEYTKISAPKGQVNAKRAEKGVHVRAGYDIRVTEYTDPSADMETVPDANGVFNGRAYGVLNGRFSSWPSKTITPIIYHQPHLVGWSKLSNEIDLTLYKPEPLATGKIDNIFSKEGIKRDITVSLHAFRENGARPNLGISLGDDPERGEKYLTISWNNRIKNIFLGDLPHTCTLNFYEGEFFPKTPTINKIAPVSVAEPKPTLTEPSLNNKLGTSSEASALPQSVGKTLSSQVKEPTSSCDSARATSIGSTESKGRTAGSIDTPPTVRAPAVSSSSFGSKTSPVLFNKKIEEDRRFKKSNEPGILWIAESMMKIDDEVLRSYGFTEEQWERRGGGYDNIVIIKDLQNPVNIHTLNG